MENFDAENAVQISEKTRLNDLKRLVDASIQAAVDRLPASDKRSPRAHEEAATLGVLDVYFDHYYHPEAEKQQIYQYGMLQAKRRAQIVKDAI